MKHVEKSEFSYIAHLNVKWYNYFEKQFGSVFKKFNIYLPYDPTLFLLVFT